MFSLFGGGLLWALSLTQVAFYTPQQAVIGYWVLLTGWLGFAVFQFAWYANLLLLLAVLWMRPYPQRATWLAVLGVVVAGQAFWFETIPGEMADMPVQSQGLGFWFWYFGVVLMTLGVIFGTDGTEEVSAPPDEG